MQIQEQLEIQRDSDRGQKMGLPEYVLPSNDEMHQEEEGNRA